MININNRPHLASFLHNVVHDIEKLKIKPTENPNVTQVQLKAVSELQQIDNLTIKMANKGGNVVLMDTPHYIDIVMCQKILSNHSWTN